MCGKQCVSHVYFAMFFSNPCFIDWNGGYSTVLSNPTSRFFSLTLVQRSGEQQPKRSLRKMNLFRETMLQSSTPTRLTRLIWIPIWCTPSLNHPFLPSACHSGRLDPRWGNACWVWCLLCHGCLDTPSKKTLWVISSRASAWGSCSYRRVRLKIKVKGIK